MKNSRITNEAVRHLTEYGGPWHGAVLYVGRSTGNFYADIIKNRETTRVAFGSREEMTNAVSAHMLASR